MFRCPTPRSAWVALVFASGALHASQVEEPVHFGLQAMVATPRQDLHDITGKAGIGGGFFFERDLAPEWSLRTRFDYATFREEPSRTQARLASLIPDGSLKVAANWASIGMDVRMRPESLKGVFLLGGIFGSRMEFETIRANNLVDLNGQPLPGFLRSKEKTNFKLGLACGAGYAFSSAFSMTFRYTATNLDGVTLATLEGGFEYRF